MQAGPFLKMYALYINNNNTAQETLQTWKKKSKVFENFLQVIEHGVEKELVDVDIKVEKALEVGFLYLLALKKVLRTLRHLV